MIDVVLDGEQRQMEFRDFARLVCDGRVPVDAPVRGDVLTAGRTLPAGSLRTYAILRGLPVPPPHAFPPDREQPNLDATLARIRWEPSIRPMPAGGVAPTGGEADAPCWAARSVVATGIESFSGTDRAETARDTPDGSRR